MRLYKYFPAVLLGVAAFVSGCSTTTEPSTNSTDSSKVHIAAGATMTYYEQRLDTTGGQYGQDQPDPNSVDSVHSTVVDTNATAYGKTGVLAIFNSRASAGSDTTYLWQDGQGNVYQYNYAVDILNNLSGLVQYVGHPIVAGWVQLANLSGTTSTWVAARDTEQVTVPGVPIPIQVTITDNSTKKGDTTVSVSGSAVSVIHTQHVVTANSVLGILATLYIDNYINYKYGTVMNVVHSFTVAAPFNVSVSGQLRAMTKHP